MPHYRQYFKTHDCVVLVKGDKAPAFLHGQFTNSITDLKNNQGNYNLFLSIKGKIRADLFVFRFNDVFHLLIPGNFFSLLTDHLKKMAFLSACEIQDVSREHAVYHVIGTLPEGFSAPSVDHVAGLPFQNTVIPVFRTDRLGTEGCDFVVSATAEEDFMALLARQNAAVCGEEQKELIRVKNGVAKVGVDVMEDHLPQEARLDRALNFNKGCYLGQEVVARLQHRGHINRVLTLFKTAAQNVHSGDSVMHKNEVCGRVTSAVFDSGENRTWFFACVPVKLVQEKTVFVMHNDQAVPV